MDYIYMTMVPYDYNGAEKFLSSHDMVALLSEHNALHVCGHAGVNEATVLPVV